MSEVELTQEQKERIRKNKERALAIQKRKREEKEREERKSTETAVSDDPGAGGIGGGGVKWKRAKQLPDAKDKDATEETGAVELEDFEVDASPFVTKKEAMKMYLLPEGTLAVCKFTEKENPRNKGWTPMKLYDRAEIRQRARERWGGVDGLMEERQRREEKQFQQDLKKTKDIFE